jgi:hypothetical protein
MKANIKNSPIRFSATHRPAFLRGQNLRSKQTNFSTAARASYQLEQHGLWPQPRVARRYHLEHFGLHPRRSGSPYGWLGTRDASHGALSVGVPDARWGDLITPFIDHATHI